MAKAKVNFTTTLSTNIFMSNSSISHYLSAFVSDVSHYSLPSKFTYPFHYQAHPLALVASEELQQKLKAFHPVDTKQQGRMYGVLIVKDASNSVVSFILVLIFWLRLNCSISFGENGELNSEPRGRPYHVTGTLNGLPP